MLQIGSLVDNKYKILSEVGRGGMSVVYLAINERANKTWAVKEVRKDGVCDFEAVKQGLVVETDMLKKLNHPFLPSIIDVIDTEDSFLIVMDYIEGKSLNSVLKKGGAQPQDLVIKWGIQLCDVLGYLHSREPSIIYRDMKPANVMLKPSGDITLIDFGTAREFKNRSMVEDTTCLGTRGYAAPEQFGGRGQTDPRTDVYCLGATLYHLVTGHSPAEPPYEIKPLSYWDPSFYGSGLEQIIAKCCQQDPSQRYQSCAELMYDLENVSTLDLAVQRKRDQKWKAFMASVILCGVGLLGVAGFSIAKNIAASNSYGYFIDEAKAVANITQLEPLIQQAVNVDSTRYEAYDLLLSNIESDGYLDKTTEWSAIMNCLNGSSGTNVMDTNISHLQRADKEQYADIMFRVGKLLFLMSDGSTEDLKNSVAYFNKALEDGEMAESDDPAVQNKAKIAASMAQIGSSLEPLINQSLFSDNADYSYKELYENLNSLVSDYPIDSMGSVQYGIALYNRVAFMLVDYYASMNEDGVSAQSLTDLADKLENSLKDQQEKVKDLQQAAGLNELINNALNNVTAAKQNIRAMTMGGAK